MAILQNGPRSSQTTPPPTDTATLQTLKAIHLELAALRRMLDEFIGVFLNARFSGKGNDRWSGWR